MSRLFFNSLFSGGDGANGPVVGGGLFGVPSHNCRCDSGCSNEATVSLPNVRLVSANFHSDGDVPDTLATHMVTQMGQFLDHDITLTPETHHECCNGDTSEDCFPINIPADDYFYSNLVPPQTCLEFSRSSAFCDTAESTREQINGITAFVDASNVYGSDDDSATALRGSDGKLLVDEHNLLPKNADGVRIAGDVRAIEMPGLAAMHTLFVREHNRIAEQLAGQGDDEWIYQNVRRIVIAEMQNIVYQGYLPVVLGENVMRDENLELKTDSEYNNQVDPSITNSFATAAYRFGHSMIQGLIQMYNLADKTLKLTYPLSENYFNLTNYEADDGIGMEQILMGLTEQPAQKNDRHVTTETTNLLFPEPDAKFGQDLVSRNLQRGRDHGIASYPAFAFHYDRANDMDCWEHRPPSITQDKWDDLMKIYHHPHHIDLFTGGLAETPVQGGLSGPVFTKIKSDQFKALKDGDRFFFTHKGQAGSFDTTAQREIMRRTLADIICDNTDIAETSEDVFKLNNAATNPYKSCASQTNELRLANINLITV